jgi:hypothetical protein
MEEGHGWPGDQGAMGGQVDLKGQNVGNEVLETRKIINK